MKEKKLYIVDTVISFRHRYVIEAKCLDHAYDAVTMIDSGNPDDHFHEVSQKFLGETIIDGREISSKEFNKMLSKLEKDKEEHSSYWLGNELIKKINYED